MAATCAGCGAKVTSFKDIVDLGDSETRRIWTSIIESLPYIGDVFLGGGVYGFFAGPLNRLNAPCPCCQARDQWVGEKSPAAKLP